MLPFSNMHPRFALRTEQHSRILVGASNVPGQKTQSVPDVVLSLMEGCREFGAAPEAGEATAQVFSDTSARPSQEADVKEQDRRSSRSIRNGASVLVQAVLPVVATESSSQDIERGKTKGGGAERF